MNFPSETVKTDVATKTMDVFLVGDWGCKDNIEQSKANCEQLFETVSIKVGGNASVAVKVHVLVNTTPLTQGDEVLVSKRSEVEDADGPPPRKQCVIPTQQKKGKGNSKGGTHWIADGHCKVFA